MLEYYLGVKKELKDELQLVDSKFKYPLIMKCPGADYNVLRWVQRWSEKENSNTMMFAQYDISGDTPPECRPQSEEVLEEEIKRKAFDERFYFPHNYEEGDQLIHKHLVIY